MRSGYTPREDAAADNVHYSFSMASVADAFASISTETKLVDDMSQEEKQDILQRQTAEFFGIPREKVGFIITDPFKEPQSLEWKPPSVGHYTYTNNVIDAKKIMESTGDLCNCCLTVSRDICCLSHNPKENPESVCTFAWECSLEALLEAMMKGCPFCTLMARNLILKDNSFTPSYHTVIQNALSCCGAASATHIAADASELIQRLGDFIEDHPEVIVDFIVEPLGYIEEDGVKRFTKVRFTPIGGSVDCDVLQDNGLLQVHPMNDLSITIEVFAEREYDPFLACVQAGPINVSPGSDESITWARNMLQECSFEHANCPSDDNVPLPTRVIEILEDGKVRLASEQPDAIYAALSYCWGGPQLFQTTTDTLAKKIAGFSASELPKTLQDGIHLTRELGLRYIWIDSLCIVQDSEDDKLRELANMARYYSTAHIIICASNKTCTASFLAAHSGCKQHPESKLPRDLLRLRVFNAEGGLSNMLFRPETIYVRRAEAIEGRAWTLQERALSPRVLFFGQRALWQCSCHIQGRGGNNEWNNAQEDDSIEKFDYQRIRVALKQYEAAGDGEDEVDMRQMLQLWYQIVEEYSCRALTNETDKLHAISALASRFQKIIGGNYVAGLWDADLLQGLLWSTHPFLAYEPSFSGAPSWSWASVKSPVTFSRLPKKQPTYLCNDIELSNSSTSGSSQDAGSIHLRLFAPLLELPDFVVDPTSSERISSRNEIALLLRKEYLHQQLNIAHFSATMSNRDLARVTPSRKEDSNRDWKAPKGSALLF